MRGARPTRAASSSFEGVGFSYETAPRRAKDVSFDVPAGRAVAIVGPDRRREVDAGEPAAALLRRHSEGRVADRRHRRPRPHARVAPRAVQHRAAGAAALLRNDFENIRYGKPTRPTEEVEARARRRRTRTTSSRACPGLQDDARRARGEDLRRRTPADRRRPGVPAGCPDPDPRRADVVDRLPHRDGDPRRARPADGGPDDDHDRPPALDPPHVDEILVLDDGESSSSGTHDELLASVGLYRELWEAQTRRRASATAQLRRQSRGRAPAPGSHRRRRREPVGRRRAARAQADAEEPALPAIERELGRGRPAAATEDRPARDADQDPGRRRRVARRPVRDGLRAPRLRGLLRRGARPHAVDVHDATSRRRRRRPPATSPRSPSASGSATAGRSRRCTTTVAASA